jgi:hypothetical protein
MAEQRTRAKGAARQGTTTASATVTKEPRPRTRAKTVPTAGAPSETVGTGLSPEETAKQLSAVSETAIQGAREGLTGQNGNGIVAPARVGEVAGSSDVTDELTGGGVAFGEFVKSVGLAVAAAQEELDKTLRETAKALSETQIDVIAVFEQVTNDDDGSMAEGIVHNQKLPLINYIMPTAYHWSRVYLESDMKVQEFNSRNGFDIQQKSFNAGASVSGTFGPLGGKVTAAGGFSVGSSSTNLDVSNSTDTAAGSLHMEATLEPRTDIQLPQPFILQKGPTIDLQVGAKVELKADTNDPNKVTGYQVAMTAVLRKTDGSPNGTKSLATVISDPTLIYTSDGKTDANGEMKITVTRRVLDPATDVPIQALVRVTFGLVTQTAGIAL